MIHVRRVREAAAPEEGRRFLVDALWPRGVRKEDLAIEAWLRDASPSDALRRWFGHDPERWEGFRERYLRELDARPSAWEPLLRAAREGPVTLLFDARDPERNNAVALRDYLEARLPRGRPRGAPRRIRFRRRGAV
jgi:uncharacterized protein YeaO (DUF488 family)